MYVCDRKGIIMKKGLLIIFVMVTVDNYGFLGDFQSKPLIFKQEEPVTFLEADAINKSIPRADFQQEDEIMDEYDQNITDNVKPPVISPLQAMCQELLAGLLIRYIIMREMTYTYLERVKNTITQWYHKIIDRARNK